MGAKFFIPFAIIGMLILGETVSAQIVLSTTLDVNKKPRLFFKSNSIVVFSWQNAPAGSKLKLGTLTGIYKSASVPVSGSSFNLLPDSLSLSVARYYAVLTNSDSSSLSGIQKQAAANPLIAVSNQIEFIIESQASPSAIAPVGNEPSGTPLFRWTAVPGVPAYQVVLSKTPFQVTRDPATGELSVIGANLVWRYITKTNSAPYGSINTNPDYNTITPAPLISGNEYNYTILNVYDEDGNPAYTSDVFGGVVSFKYTGASTIQPPTLKAPAGNATFYGDNSITFSWNPAANTNLYTLYLFQRVTTTTGAKQEYDVPLWNSTTTGTIIDYPAKGTLASGKYLWYISASDANGNGNASASSIFNYIVPMGKIMIQAVSTGGGNLVGFQARARAVVGGITPVNPFITSNDRFIIDSVVVGTYQFTGSKIGYADSTITVQVTASPGGASIPVVLPLRPLPSAISGSVIDQADKPVSGALVQIQNLLTAVKNSSLTSSSGQFSISMESGTYSVQATKAGYLPSSTITMTVATGDQKLLSSPLKIQNEEATVSGNVVNDAGAAISLASVTARSPQSGESQTAITNSSGNFSFNLSTTLSSGIWTITAARDGFVPPPARQVTLTAGQTKQLENIIMLPNANTVNGNVYELVTSGGQTGTGPLSNAVVTATPASGAVLSATTTLAGQYSMSLKQGTYRLQVSRDNYSIAPGSQSVYDVTVTVGQTVSGINFTLQQNPSSISGSVLLTDGSPVSGATVSTGTGTSVQATASGTYTLTVPSGTFTLNASKEGYGSPSPVTVSVAVGQKLKGVNFQMSPNAGVISGTVQSNGEPIAGATVTSVNAASGSVLSSTATASGTFSMSVQPGTWNVTASKPGFISSAISVTVGPGQRSTGNTFTLVSNTATITGLVSDGSTPIRNAAVTITEAGTGANPTTTVSKSDGTFAATVSAGKSYSVNVSRTGYSSLAKTTSVLASGNSVSLPFTLTATPSSVSGTVKNNLSQPLFPVKIYLKSSLQKLLDSATTDNTGAYRFGTYAGNFVVAARLQGYKPDSVQLTVTVGQSLANINLNLAENFAVISGSITGSGAPVSNALVNITGANNGATVTSAVDGSFIVSRLIGGIYSIKITREGFADTTISSFAISDGESKRLTLNLLPLNGRINGRLQTDGGQPIDGGTVFVRSGSGKSYTATSGSNGAFTLSSLPLEKYFITAAKNGFSSTKVDSVALSASVLTGNSVIADFTANSLRIKGRVTDAGSSAALNNATVALSGTSGAGSSVTNATGDYTLDNLALSSSYTLTVSKTGYAASTKNITAGAADTLITENIQLTSNIGIMSGTVKDISGAPLPFTVTVRATSAANSYSATTDANGNFSVSGVAKGVDYAVATDFFRQGYDNTSTTVPFPSDQASVTGVALVIEPKTGGISGNASVADALIELTEESGKIEPKILNSFSDGSYSFSFLPTGNFRITPSKEGFSFTPETQTVALTSSQKAVMPAFSAAADTGSIFVSTVELATDAGMSGVAISVVSSDTVVVRNGTSNANGELLFTNLPAKGRTYIVRASLPGYSTDIAEANPSLQTNTLVNVQFKLSANTSSLAGKVVRSGSGEGLSGVQVTVRRSTGEQFSAATETSGEYAFNSLPGDDYAAAASKEGFLSDTLHISVGANENVRVPDLTLAPTTVNVNGTVLYNGTGAAGLTITAISAGSFTAQSDPSGNFTFLDLPVQVNSDTTVYQLTVERDGLSLRTVRLLIPLTQVGQTLSIPPVILPSGKIRFTVTDGLVPLDGVRVVFTPFNGTTVESYTTVSGEFETAATLEQGVHRFSLARDPYLSTAAGTIAVTLESDTAKKTSLQYDLPFRLLPSGEITASDTSVISLLTRARNNADSAWLYFKRESQNSFASVAMERVDDTTFSGKMPPQFSTEKLAYYAIARRETVLYSSSEVFLTPTAKGILSFIDFEPSLDNATLRPNDRYSVRLVTRDGGNEMLGSKFSSSADTAATKILWQSSDPSALTLSQTDTSVTIATGGKEGVFTVTATAILNNVSLSQSFSVNVTNVVLKEISIGGIPPGGELNNSSRGIQLTIDGRDTSGKSVNVGSSIQWSLLPLAAGSIDRRGFLTVDSTLLGKVTVTATDSLTALMKVIVIRVVATIDSSRSYVLTDMNGMQLSIPPKSVGASIDLQLEEASFGPSKKYVFLRNTGQNFVASPNLYYLTYKGDALAGDSLKQPASFQMTIDASLKYFNGDKIIGLYDPMALEWKILSSSEAQGSLGKQSAVAASVGQVLQTDLLTRLKAQYTILALNEPLGIKHAAVLPNPFSPQVAPLKIGYVVNTTDQQAVVSVAIYNIRGELVRTLLEGDPQFPGRYTSRSSGKSIDWDGKTNDGSMALNGRYIIRIKAKDSTGEKVELLQVVLIK